MYVNVNNGERRTGETERQRHVESCSVNLTMLTICICNKFTNNKAYFRIIHGFYYIKNVICTYELQGEFVA